MEILHQALERLGASGFSHDLRASDSRLRDVVTGATNPPERLRIEEVVRFERE